MAEGPKRRDSSGSVHTFICSYPGCHVTFSRNDRLIIHMRTHTGEVNLWGVKIANVWNVH